MKLHGIELFSNDVERTKDFYSSVIGLRTKLDEDGLKVFDPGIEGVDLNISGHYPANKISLSFLVKDLDAFVEIMMEQKLNLEPPYNSHLGLRAVTVVDNDGCRVVVHSPTNLSPQWLKDKV